MACIFNILSILAAIGTVVCIWISFNITRQKSRDKKENAGWMLWKDTSKPNLDMFVWIRYGKEDAPQLAKVCKHGCCINVGFGPMVLPKYWKHCTLEEAALKQQEFDSLRTIRIKPENLYEE